MCAIVFCASTATRLPIRSRGPPERLAGRGDERRARGRRAVERARRDHPHRRRARLQARCPSHVEPGELGVTRQQGGDELRRVREDEELRVDSLLREEATMPGIERERGRLERQRRDRHRRGLGASRDVGSARGAGRQRAQGYRGRHKQPSRRACPDRPPGHPGHCNTCCEPIRAWISSRRARKAGKLRVARCDRGRGRPTSIDPTTRPGARLNTSTRSAR